MTSNTSPDKVTSKLIPKQIVAIGGAVLLLLTGISVAIASRSNPNTNQKATEKIAAKALPVATIEVRQEDSYRVLQNYTGAVAAQRASELGFERGGNLVWLGVDRGSRVIKGEAIARLDKRNLEAQKARLLAQKARELAILAELKNGARREDIAAARAEVSNLRNQLELEQIKADRRRSLYAKGAISRENLDEATYSVKALNDRLNISRSRLEELLNGTRREQIAAQQAVVRQLDASIAELEIDIDKSTIFAPFSGIIAARQLDEGTVVRSGQSVFRLVEDAPPEVEIGLPTQMLSVLKIGSLQQVEIGDRVYAARVASILPELDPATQTRTVILKLESNSNLVAAKEVARLQITRTVKEKGYWLPTTALVRGERGLWSCFVAIDTEGQYRIEKRDLEVLSSDGDRVFVRGVLSNGDKVVSKGTQRLVPNQLVRPLEATYHGTSVQRVRSQELGVRS